MIDHDRRSQQPDSVPDIRIRTLNPRPVRPEGAFVLYWMNAFRRASWNFSLDRAVEWSTELGRPLLVFESLPSGRRWDGDRRHAFALQGMAVNAEQFDRMGVPYYPYVEPVAGAAREAVVTLARKACVVVTDDFPLREHAADTREVADEIGPCIEAVDSNGLLPLRAASQVFSVAHSFRRFLQRHLRDYLLDQPSSKPLARVKLPPLDRLPREFSRRWPKAGRDLMAAAPEALAALPLDHSVAPTSLQGGSVAAERVWRAFLAKKLASYPDARNHPDDQAGSGLSPYLHFGHISVHRIFADLARRERWSPDRLGEKVTGKAEGWWGMSAAAEAFLDELVTWRELGYNRTALSDDYDRYASLPDWARATLARHARDRREHVYSREELEQARTHDPIWNAAQTELVRDGRIHNYLRMLWGKKILQWTSSPQDALDLMIDLNNKYALDGRDPNSYSGIFWVLGRYDRAWGPERPVFGTVRYMTSENTARKVRLKKYLDTYT